MNIGSDIYRILFNKLDLNKTKDGFAIKGFITVKLDSNGGTGSPAGIVSGKLNTYVDKFPTIGSMKKDGYKFIGWNTTTTATTALTTYTITASNDQTLYAIWSQLYTVTFDANGATSVSPPGTVSGILNDVVTVFPTIGSMEKPGYKFIGWNTTTTATTALTTYTITASNGQTLYAIWSPLYTVTFNANGAESGSIASKYVVKDGTLTFPAKGSLMKSGYTFEGWSLNANGTGTVYKNGESYPITQATTFYAVWWYSNVEYELIVNENNYLQKEINSLVDSTSKNTRLNTYFAEDQALVLYLNRILMLTYIVIYVFVLLSLYLNRATTPITTTISIAVIFLALPYFIDLISKYMYYRFLNIMQLFYKGNSVYLYKPPEKLDTVLGF